MESGKVEIVQVSQETTLTRFGGVERVMKVQYMVGSHGPFFRDFPAAGFKGADALVAIEADAEEIRRLNPSGR